MVLFCLIGYVDSYLNVFVRGMRTFDLKFECLNQFFPSQLMHIGSKQHSFRVSYYSSSLTLPLFPFISDFKKKSQAMVVWEQL
jgi:hypothetical protein